MKKLIIGLLCLLLALPSFALSEALTPQDQAQTFDLSGMTLDELNALKNEVNAAIIAASAEIVDGYSVLSGYSEYARRPDAHTGEQIRFDGEVVQVVEGIEYNVYRVAMNGDSDCMFYVTFTPTIESERVLEDDKVTVCGQFMGLYTYTSTLGGEITIPWCEADSISEQIVEVGEYPATRQDPAPIGATIRYDGSSYSNPAVTDLTVTKVIRGDAAWQMVKGFNRYNDAPADNQEYVVVYVRTAAISSENDQQAELDDYDFRFISASGMEYKRESVTGITPELTNLYPGAEFEGIVVGLIEKGDSPLMVYLKDSDDPVWFDLNRRIPIELPEDIVLETLQKGDKGDDVKNMQTMLVEMGYLNGTPDGDFGGKTESAVKAYQEAMGLEATGIADEATLRLILTGTTPE